MKIAVIGANGKAGRLIVSEAVNRGMEVTAVVRHENKSAARQVIQKDIMDLTKDDLRNFDVVVNAFGVWEVDKMYLHSEVLNHLSNLLSGSHIRLLIVGGAGSLYTDKNHTMMISDAPDFPADYKPVAEAMKKSLGELRGRNDVEWTYGSPAAEFDAEGERTGNYILAGEEFTTNKSGKSYISYADYAVAMIDEAENGSHRKQRISVLGV